MTSSMSPSPTPAADKPPRAPRWIPVSLKLFGAVIVFIGVCSVTWLGVHYSRQRAVIRLVEKAGGSVMTEILAPYWLTQWLGPQQAQVFEEVIGINLADTHATDSDLARLKAMHGLAPVRWLCLDNTDVTDEGMLQLSGMCHLHTLKICGTKITDAGLARLTGLPKLNSINLQQTGISDAGLQHLRAFPALQTVTLHRTKISDKGLVHLKDLKKLRILFVDETDVTDWGLSELQHALPDLVINK